MDINTSVKETEAYHSFVKISFDTGKHLDTVVKLLKHRGAASIEVVTLLDKPRRQKLYLLPKYIGLTTLQKYLS